MEAILLVILQYGLAAVLGGGALKGGEFAVRRYKGRNGAGLISPESCAVTHSKIDGHLDGIKEDLGEVKEALGKLIEMQIEMVELKGDLRHEIDAKMERHIDGYHKAA